MVSQSNELHSFSFGGLCATASAVADDSYFPIKTKTGGEGVTEFEPKWYGQSLERMKEPRLPAPSYDPGKRKLTAFLALCKFLVDKSTLSERPKNKGHKLI